MKHTEYERIRMDVSKRYKDEIHSLKMDNQKLMNLLKEEQRKRVKLESELKRVKAEFDNLPESVKHLVEMATALNGLL